MERIDFNDITNADLQCIINPVLAKRLFNLGLGKYCLDIKPNNKNPMAVVFLFEKEETVLRELNKFSEESRENKILRQWYTPKS